MEGTEPVRPGQNARPIEREDLIRIGIPGLHIRDIVDRIDRARVQQLREDMDEFSSCNRRVHRLGGLTLIGRLNQAVCNCVVDIIIIPVRPAILQRHEADALLLVQRRGQLHGLRHGQAALRLEIPRRYAVDEVVLQRALDKMCIRDRIWTM